MNLILYCIVNRKIVTSNQQQCSGQDECQAACHGARRHRATVTAWSRHADAPLRHHQCHVSRHASRRRNQARLVLIIEMYKGWTVDVDTSTLVLEHRLQKIYQKTKIIGLGWWLETSLMAEVNAVAGKYNMLIKKSWLRHYCKCAHTVMAATNNAAFSAQETGCWLGLGSVKDFHSDIWLRRGTK